MAKEFTGFSDEIDVSVEDEMVHRDQEMGLVDPNRPSTIYERASEMFEDIKDYGPRGFLSLWVSS